MLNIPRRRSYLLLFLGLSLVYHSDLKPNISTDTLGSSLIPLSILLDHTVRLDRFGPWVESHPLYSVSAVVRIRGHYYSGYPIGGAIFATPLYLPVLAFGDRLRKWDSGALLVLARILEKFAAVSITAFSAVVLLMLLRRVTSDSWAWALTLVYALGTKTCTTSSQALWQHTTGELAIIGALLFLDRRQTWWCGACTACALVIRPTNLVLVPAVLVALALSSAKLSEYVRFAALPAAGGLLVLSYNLFVFRNASGAYPLALFDGSFWAGLGGILVSPGRGLLIYTPVAVFALAALLPDAAMSRGKHTAVLVASIVFAALHLIVIAKFGVWWGGYGWGPRLLTEIMPPLVVLMALGSGALEGAWAKRAFAALAIYGCLIQGLGLYFYPKGHWDNTPLPVDQAPERAWNWRDNPIVRTAAAGPFWEPYAIAGAALRGGIPGAQRKLRELGLNPY